MNFGRAVANLLQDDLVGPGMRGFPKGLEIVPGLTGMSDGDAAEEDAWGEICQNAVPSLNMTEPDTGIPDMARILEEATATTAESDPAQSAGLTFKRGGELERSRLKLNRPRRGRPRVRIV